MNVVAWIVGVVLAGIFTVAGGTKLLDLDRMREHFGYRKGQYQLIGLTEVVAAAAVVVGLIWTKLEWIAVAAGIGLCTLMLGALMAHARVEDEGKKAIPAGVMFVLAVVFMIAISVR